MFRKSSFIRQEVDSASSSWERRTHGQAVNGDKVSARGDEKVLESLGVLGCVLYENTKCTECSSSLVYYFICGAGEDHAWAANGLHTLKIDLVKCRETRLF